MEWASSVTTGSSSAKQVLVALANFHQKKTGLCMPSKPTLVGFTELNWKTLDKWLAWLEIAGFITIEDRPGTSKNYIIHFDNTTSKIGGARKAGNAGNLVKGTPSKNGAPSKIGTPSKIGDDPLQNRSEPPPKLEAEQVNGINGESKDSLSNNVRRTKKKAPNPKNETYLKPARAMWEKIQSVTDDKKTPNFENWANTIRLIVEQDQRTPEEIWRTFQWANADPFWQDQILSPANLRKHFQALYAKSKKERHHVQPAAAPKQTAAERQREKLRQLEGSQGVDAQAMDTHDGDVRPSLDVFDGGGAKCHLVGNMR
jgi:hypothetical protein